MKIRVAEGCDTLTRLRDLSKGDTFQLKSRLSLDTSLNDPFLVIDMQTYTLYAYEDRRVEHRDKCAVLNLKNNRLSYICNRREVFPVESEVVIC